MRLAWLLLALACTGCHPVPVVPHDAWPTIAGAAASWCTRSHGRCCPRAVPVRAVTQARCAELTKVPKCIGVYVPKGRWIGIVFDEIPTDSELRRVALHEYGHACGLGHNDAPESIMKSGGVETEISEGDLEALP